METIHELFCKGPFPDGRMGECWVKVGTLKLNRPVIPHRDLHVYRCSACAQAEKQLRWHIENEAIPWWDPDYRVAVISALSVPAQVFPFIKVVDATPQFHPELKRAVQIALAPLLEERPTRRVVASRRMNFVKSGVIEGSRHPILQVKRDRIPMIMVP